MSSFGQICLRHVFADFGKTAGQSLYLSLMSFLSSCTIYIYKGPTHTHTILSAGGGVCVASTPYIPTVCRKTLKTWTPFRGSDLRKRHVFAETYSAKRRHERARTSPEPAGNCPKRLKTRQLFEASDLQYPSGARGRACILDTASVKSLGQISLCDVHHTQIPRNFLKRATSNTRRARAGARGRPYRATCWKARICYAARSENDHTGWVRWASEVVRIKGHGVVPDQLLRLDASRQIP